MKRFAATLRKLRQAAGYPSSRAFFKGRGGQPEFGCTYRQYLNIEAGRSKPSRKVLEKIVGGLSLAGKEPAREFFTAYFRAITGSDILTDFMLRVFRDVPEEIRSKESPLVDSMARSAMKGAVTLTAEASRFVTSSKECYWPYIILTNDSGRWEPRDLAKMTGLPVGGLRKTLARLVRLKLAEKDKNGRYFCPNAGSVFIHPRDELRELKNKRLRKIWESMYSKKGKELAHTSYFMRAPEKSVLEYLPYLSKSLRGSVVCSSPKKAPGSAFFLMELRVRNILPF